jgi:hypothetical protein
MEASRTRRRFLCIVYSASMATLGCGRQELPARPKNNFQKTTTKEGSVIMKSRFPVPKKTGKTGVSAR